MIEIRLGDRYAKSIMALASERGVVEEIKKDFELIQGLCKSTPAFLNMLKSPLIRTDKKQKIMDQIFGGKVSVEMDQFLRIIIRKRREGYLPDIAIRFLDLYDRENNITRGLLVTAAPLPDAQKAAIRSIVEKKFKTRFEIEEKTDPGLIGGFRLHFGDLLFDGSVAGALEDLKQEFSKNQYIRTH